MDTIEELKMEKLVSREIFPLFFILLLFLNGCAANGRMRADIQRLELEIEEVKLKTFYGDENFKKDYQEFKNKTQRDSAEQIYILQDLKAQNEAIQQNLKDFQYVIQRVQKGELFPSGPIDDIKKQLQDMEQRVALLEEIVVKKEEAKVPQFEPSKPEEPKPVQLPEPLKKEEMVKPIPTPKEEQKMAMLPKEEPYSPDARMQLYKGALDKLKNGDYEGARKHFKDFLIAYPKDELSDNAQYWIGECHYAQKDFEGAILEFDEVIKKYPSGDKVPAALLKQGLSFFRLGDKLDAKTLLSRVIRDFPHTEEAKIAKKNLEQIK